LALAGQPRAVVPLPLTPALSPKGERGKWLSPVAQAGHRICRMPTPPGKK
jgi:hypothetical protein